MSQCVVMRFTLRTLLSIVIIESFVVFDNVVSSIYQCEA